MLQMNGKSEKLDKVQFWPQYLLKFLVSARPNPRFHYTTETETEYWKITETEPKPNPEQMFFNQYPCIPNFSNDQFLKFTMVKILLKTNIRIILMNILLSQSFKWPVSKVYNS